MVKTLLTTLVLGSTGMAMTSMATPSPGLAYKRTDDPLTLDIHFQTKK